MGKDIGAVPVLQELAAKGHQLILYTMRSDKFLEDAVAWFAANSIPLYAVNKNPTQHEWTNSPKIYCHMYVDDAALGIPLIEGLHSRPYVHWGVVRSLLLMKGVL